MVSERVYRPIMSGKPAPSERVPYELGLHEVADDTYAYLQPDGSWGLSNAGLVVGDGEALLADTLFDARLTASMLSAMDAITASSPISTVVNTHANGDHCYGNQLLPGARIVASVDTSSEMSELPPSALQALKTLDLGEVANDFVQHAFGAFDFSGVELVPPTMEFSGSCTLSIGGRDVELVEVGPAHTAGDVIVYVPDARTVFTGDIAFIGSTPIIWAGPVSNWLKALDKISALGVETIVPGHGPVSGVGALGQVAGYLGFVHGETARRASTSMSCLEVALDIDLGEYADWLDAERIVINVDQVLSELRPGHERMDPFRMMRELGAYKLECGG